MFNVFTLRKCCSSLNWLSFLDRSLHETSHHQGHGSRRPRILRLEMTLRAISRLGLIYAACLSISGVSVVFAQADATSPDVDTAQRLKEIEAAEANLSKQLSIPTLAETPQIATNSSIVVPTSTATQKNNSHAVVYVKPLPNEKAAQQKEAKKNTTVQEPSSPAKIQEENLALRTKYAESLRELASMQENCGAAQKKVEDLQKRAARAEEQAKRFAKDLDEARARLMLAETEVERLSSRYSGRNKVRTSNSAAALQENTNSPVDIGIMPGSVSKDLPLATVLTESASLRTGPGGQYSTLMTVNQGQSLAIESRQGEWLRVITPLGARAWVQSGSVRIGQTGRNISNKNSSNQAPRGIADPEDAAFNSLAGGLKSKR